MLTQLEFKTIYMLNFLSPKYCVLKMFKIEILFLQNDLLRQIVWILMRCCIMWHLIWIQTISKGHHDFDPASQELSFGQFLNLKSSINVTLWQMAHFWVTWKPKHKCAHNWYYLLWFLFKVKQICSNGQHTIWLDE